jgi:Na+-driven multidrug efflux pump
MFYGAKKYIQLNYIIRYGIGSSFIVTLFSSTFVYFFADIFSQWFTDDPEILAISVGFLKLLCFIYPLIAIAITSGRVMQGLGKGLPVLIITVIRVLGLGAPLAYYFSMILGKPVEWNWYALMLSATTSFLIAINWVMYELNKINLKHGV